MFDFGRYFEVGAHGRDLEEEHLVQGHQIGAHPVAQDCLVMARGWVLSLAGIAGYHLRARWGDNESQNVFASQNVFGENTAKTLQAYASEGKSRKLNFDRFDLRLSSC